MVGGSHKSPGLVGFLDVKRPLVRAFNRAKVRLDSLIESGAKGAVRAVSSAYRKKLGAIQQRIVDRYLSGQLDSAIRAKGRILARHAGVDFPGDVPLGHGRWGERKLAPSSLFGEDLAELEATQRLNSFTRSLKRVQSPKGGVTLNVKKAQRPQYSKLREAAQRDRYTYTGDFETPEMTVGEATEIRAAKEVSRKSSAREATRNEARVRRLSERQGKRLKKEGEKLAARRDRDFENRLVSSGYLDRPPMTRRRGRPKRSEAYLPPAASLSKKQLPVDITDPDYARKTGHAYMPAKGPKRKTPSPWMKRESGVENMRTLIDEIEDPVEKAKALKWAKDSGFLSGD
jgi:hypothetical protein